MEWQMMEQFIQTLVFQCQPSSFFLGAGYRPVFLAEVHSLVYNGQGGYTHADVWTMPVPNRRFIIQSINKHVKEMDEKAASSKGLQKADKSTNPMTPDFVKSHSKPTYSSKTKKSK